MAAGAPSLADVLSSPYALEAHRWERYEREPPLVGRGVFAIVVASALFALVVAADVSAYYSTPAVVTITRINWFVGNVSVGNQTGLTVGKGQVFHDAFVCQIFCPRVMGVMVDRPFVLVNDSIAYPWYEYVNMTLRAPAAAYDGPLSIRLLVSPVMLGGPLSFTTF